MTKRAETVHPLGSPATRATSSATRSRRIIHATAAATIGIAVIAGCGDDEDTTESAVTDDDTTGSTTTVEDTIAGEDTTGSTTTVEGDDSDGGTSNTSPPTPPSSDEAGSTGEAASPADHDARFTCGLIEHWGGQQTIDEHSVHGFEMLSGILAAAGAASAAGDERYDGFIVDDVGDGTTTGLPDPESAGIDALVNACADVGHEIDEDAPKDDEAATEIAGLACDAVGRWDDEWTFDDLEDELSEGIQSAEVNRRIAVARATFALSGYDEQYEGLGDAGQTFIQGFSMLDGDTLQGATDAMRQECQALTSD